MFCNYKNTVIIIMLFTLNAFYINKLYMKLDLITVNSKVYCLHDDI